MDNFKPKKAKALMHAAAQVAYDQSSNVIDPLIKAYPQATAPLRLLQASFGILLAYKQERLNQFTQFIMDNPEVFTKDLLSSDDFKEGLVVFMDSYFKLRGKQKLLLAQRIFNDFSSSANMPVYPLERYDDTLEKISDAGIRFLGFIYEEVPDIKEKYLNAKLALNGNTINDDETKKHWREVYITKEPLKTFVEEHLKEQVQLRMKDYSGDVPLEEETKISDEIRYNLNLVISELEQLGLIRTYTHTTQGWSATSTTGYNLTDYGNKFISVIKPEITN